MNIINELDGTYEQSAQATMVGAMDYVEHLRNSEAYDNTVLIVMSDHGYNGSLGQSGEGNGYTHKIGTVATIIVA